jgi:hypothetical protein
MPTFKITDPNSGRTLNVTGDSPPSQEELTQLFAQFQVDVVPEVDPSITEQQGLLQDLAAEQGPVDAALIGAGRGLTTIARALGLADPEDELTKQAFQELEKLRPISTTVGEVAGEAAPFLLPGGLVAKAVTIPGRIAATGALGAAEAGLITKGKGGKDEDILKSSSIGGAVAGSLELALPVIGRFGGKIIRNVTGKAPTTPLFNKQGQPSQEFIQALDKAGLSFDDVTAEANKLIDTGNIDDAVSLARKDFLESQGIIPTRAQVTGDATEFQAQQELAKTSGRVRRAIEGQEVALSNRFENAVTSTGGSANASNSSVIDFVADRSIDLDSQISAAYKQARELAPTEKVIKPTRLTESIRGIAGSDNATGGLASATRDILRSKGVLAQGKGLKSIGKVDAKTAEEIRIDMNGLFDSLTPFGKKKLAGLKNSLDLDVEKAIGQDIFAAPRAAKAKFEKDLSRAKINKFDSRKKNLVRDILENKVNPDRFLNDAVLSKTVRSTDLEQLKRYLSLDGDEAGSAAWNDLRAEAMEHIRSTAIKEVAGEPALSRAGLEKALDQFGRDKLRVLFSKEERKFLQDMLKTSKLREPVRGTALGKGPSAQAIKNVTNAVNRIPLINSVFGGAAELITTDLGGRTALRQPTLNRLAPSRLTQATPALIPAITAQEQQ